MSEYAPSSEYPSSGEPDCFHVSSVLNRDSIAAHGLDVRLMGAARGIAGSRRPEQDGCFIARGTWQRDYFVNMNNTGGPVDVWRVSNIDPEEFVTSPEGYSYVPGAIAASQLVLTDTDIHPRA